MYVNYFRWCLLFDTMLLLPGVPDCQSDSGVYWSPPTIASTSETQREQCKKAKWLHETKQVALTKISLHDPMRTSLVRCHIANANCGVLVIDKLLTKYIKTYCNVLGVLFTMELYCTPKVNTLQLNTVSNSSNTRTRPTRTVSEHSLL